MEKAKVKTDGVAAPVMRLYNTKQAAALWGLKYKELRNLVLSGKIRPIVGIGHGWKFDGSELAAAKLDRL